MRFLPVIRGIVRTAVTWAVVWVPLSLIPFGVAAALGADLPFRALGWIAMGKAVTGAVSGATFATLLAVAGRRRTFETLSLPWIAALGAAGGALFPLVIDGRMLTTMHVAIPLSILVSGVVTSTLLGAGCASLTLAIARRAPALPAAEHSTTPAIGVGAP